VLLGVPKMAGSNDHPYRGAGQAINEIAGHVRVAPRAERR
jgi:hypothetical protein